MNLCRSLMKPRWFADETQLVVFEDMVASWTWPCTLPSGWSVEWDASLANDDRAE
jgi:hypothetical protein